MKLSEEYSLQKKKKKSNSQVVAVIQWQNLTVKRGKVIFSTTNMAGTSTDM